MALTTGQGPLYACLNHQQTFAGVSVVGGPEAAVSGDFSSQQYFLSGEEVAPTTFFSSDYDPDHHTAEGMIGLGSVHYAPQLAGPIVALLEAPCTIVLDCVLSLGEGSGAKCYLAIDGAVIFMDVMHSSIDCGDNTGGAFAEDFGFTPPLADGRYRMAWTRINGTQTSSVNGSAVVIKNGDDPIEQIGVALLGVNNAGALITEFTIYPPQDAADLPALSAL